MPELRQTPQLQVNMRDSVSKKRKRNENSSHTRNAAVDTTKPTAVFKPVRPRQYTVSVALPGSIISNALTHDIKTALAGQIARALAVFCVDEVVIFDDGHIPANNDTSRQRYAEEDAKTGYTAFADPNHFLHHILSYVETPPYLRTTLFQHHPNLRTAGALPSLDMPHHLRAEEWCEYREGVTVQSHSRDTNGTSGAVAYVKAGFTTPVRVNSAIPPNTRVTLKFHAGSEAPESVENLTADAVSPDAPREEGGYYWGYSARMAPSLSAVFTESPYEDGYDFSIGTSERGTTLDTVKEEQQRDVKVAGWKHMMVVFGGVAGLEIATKNDDELLEKGVKDPSELFDLWVNLLEGQGSRTIRTEEAIWIGLMGIRDIIKLNSS